MLCHKCKTENRAGVIFCENCGVELDFECPKCKTIVPSTKNFCGNCGQKLSTHIQSEKAQPSKTVGERKYVTVLFSDFTGYTALSERLDPEETKEIMGKVFGETAKVVDRYGGFIEKYAGDAVMAVFGAPESNEDDSIRAIKAAREIHGLVRKLSPQFEQRIGQPLSMHSGVNTGLVVTGKIDLERGTHGLMGDAINTAARILGTAPPDEIIVGHETYRQSQGFFDFEKLPPVEVKGKSEPILTYRVLSEKDNPVTVRRLSGLKSLLIGRNKEMDQLAEAEKRLLSGNGGIISISGDAGTGKSRLVEDFKEKLDDNSTQLLEAHAFAYAQNIPYFPLIDFFNRVFDIEEGDLPGQIKAKIESGVKELDIEDSEVVPYIGSLYSLHYPELEEISPELLKHRLREAVIGILSGFARKTPTIFFLEDLHWADVSFIELLHDGIARIQRPSLVICAYRPPFRLFSKDGKKSLPENYREIELDDLSSTEANSMVRSLLNTDWLPEELNRFLKEKTQGNPFYLEEVVNSLIETEVLAQENGKWRLTQKIIDLNISSTVQGVISARIDRLERKAKQILQEASVIGRVFLYEILKEITQIKDQVDQYLGGLENLDLIRARSVSPDLEYIFKHALAQEAVYKGLLKTERKEIHERIGLVMEKFFQGRLPEFYETLAFHFKQGKSTLKAVDYLIKAGQKSLKKYSLEESDQYFKDAFDLLSNKASKSDEEIFLLVKVLNEWSVVFHFRQMYTGLSEMLKKHEPQAAQLHDKETLGLYYTWLGFALEGTEHLEESYHYLIKALDIGKEIRSQKVIGYACARLGRTCVDFDLEQAIGFALRAKEVAEAFKSDHVLFLSSIWALGYAYYFRGEARKTRDVGKAFLDYGETYSDNHCTTLGYLYTAIGYFTGGDFSSAIENYEKAVDVSIDPMFRNLSKQMFAFCLAADNQSDRARENLEAVLDYTKEKAGDSFLSSQAQASMVLVHLTKGELAKGIRLGEKIKRIYLKKGSKYRAANIDLFYGKIYLQMVERSRPMTASFLLKNIRFLARNIPAAKRKSEYHFNQAINLANEIGAKGIVGQSHLGLGKLFAIRKNPGEAKEHFSKAIEIFKDTGAEVFLQQTEDALQSLMPS
jgi:class 3 adenylate cyclase/tetratricopeptide (TPR) repeat protein